MLGTVNGVSETMHPGWRWSWPNDWKWRGLRLNQVDWGAAGWNTIRSGLGALIDEKTPNGRATGFVLDNISAASNIKDTMGYFKNRNEIQAAFRAAYGADVFSNARGLNGIFSKTGDFLRGATKSPLSEATGFFGKVAPWTAGISGVFSGIETISNLSQHKWNDGISSLGETLMSAGVVASALPGVGTAAGAVLAGIGLGLWVGAKLWKNGPEIVRAIRHPIDTAKKAVYGVMDVGKKIGKGIKGTFSTVAGWFS